MTRWYPEQGSYRPTASGVARTAEAGWEPGPHMLPGNVPVHPDHVPSTVTFVVRLTDRTGSFGGRRPLWRQTSRTECGCGAGWGRTRDGIATGDVGWRLPDDVHLRTLHADHTATLPATQAIGGVA